MDEPRVLTAECLRSISGVVHGFLGRRGGTSVGAWQSLNLSRAVGDDTDAVGRNWARVRACFSGLAIVTMRQVHGADVAHVCRPDDGGQTVDGLITDASAVGLAVLTADCVPVLMIDPEARVAAAVHAGWRGTLAGIVHVAVARLRDTLGVAPARLRVAMGPAIGGCCYEVAADIGVQLEQKWGAMPDAWQRNGERGMLDLRRANRAILAEAGVSPEAIEDVGPCTACHMEEYFSHRGSGGQTGRQLSVIGWQ